MATYEVTLEDGKTYDVEVDDAPLKNAAIKQLSPVQQLTNTALSQGPLAAIGEGAQMAFEKGGQALAEQLATGTSLRPTSLPAPFNVLPTSTPGVNQVNPNVAAAIGTGVQMIPDIATSFAPAGKAASLTERGLGAAKAGLEGAMGGLGRKALPLLEDQLVAQQGALAQVGIRAGEREAALLAEKAATGQALGKAEELGGFAMKETPEHFTQIMKDPKALNDFSNFMRTVADKPIAELVKSADAPALQTLRKFAQTFREVGPEVSNTIKANIAGGGRKATEALSQVDETFGSVLKEWKNVSSKIDRIPTDVKRQKAAIQGAMRATRQAIKETKRAANKYTFIKRAILSAAGLAGIGKFILGGK